MTDIEKFNHCKSELIEIGLDVFKIVMALMFGFILSHYQEQMRGTLLPSFITGILIAFIFYNAILILLNTISIQFRAFKEAKEKLSDGIAYLLFLTWILINSQTETGVVMLYGAGIYLFFLTCTTINKHIHQGVFQEYYDRRRSQFNHTIDEPTPIRKQK